MSKPFKAILTTDIQFHDINGLLKVMRSGLPVTVRQVISSQWVSMDAQGRLVREQEGAYIATASGMSFDVSRLQFSVLN